MMPEKRGIRRLNMRVYELPAPEVIQRGLNFYIFVQFTLPVSAIGTQPL